MISKVKLKRTTSPKRKTTLAFLIIGAASFAQLLPTGGVASAQTIAEEQAQAATITARLNYLGGQVSALAERYDQAQLSLTKINQQVSTQQTQISQTQAQIVAIKSQLSQEAINAYITGGNLPEFSALLSESPTEASVRQEYLNTVTNSQTDLVASYQETTQNLKIQQSSLKTLQTQAVAMVHQVSSAKDAAQVAVNQETAQLNSVNSTIATLVKQQQELQAQQAAAAAAARAREVTFSFPASGASSPISSGSGSGRSTPGLSSGQIATALSWARQELGKPYVFGGAGPNVFDCSGLTAFVYAKAGIYLPHSAAAQYNDTTRVSLSALQPGDLIFYYSPISHVAIYIGGGQVIQALNEASPVEVSGMYWDGVPVGAGRP